MAAAAAAYIHIRCAGGVATSEAAATRRLPTTIYNLYADIDFEAAAATAAVVRSLSLSRIS